MLVWIHMFPIQTMVDHYYGYLGELYVSDITIIWDGICWFIMGLVQPIHWLHTHLLDLEESLNSEWDSITELNTPLVSYSMV